jgi:hypothetical protein
VLAAPVRIDRLVEADVGAVVLGDDLAGLLDLQLVLQLSRGAVVQPKGNIAAPIEQNKNIRCERSPAIVGASVTRGS